MLNLPPGFTLRRATPGDLSAFGEFSRQTFHATYDAFHTAEQMTRHVGERLNDRNIAAELADPACTVLALLQGSEWAGYALLHGGEAPAGVDAAHPVEIERFYVGEAWHGRGLAAPLMAAALDDARAQGHDAAWLSVWQRNAKAVRFYEKQGFRVEGQIPYVFDGTPEDDYLMVRAL